MSSTQWANIGDDAGALHALVQSIAGTVDVSTIDHLWIFPARRVAAGESTVAVVSVFETDPERRRVITAHFRVSRSRRGEARVDARFDDHASAPTAAVPRAVQGVLRRLGEEVGAEPREVSIGGSRDRWDSLIIELGGRVPGPADADIAGADDASAQHDTPL